MVQYDALKKALTLRIHQNGNYIIHNHDHEDAKRIVIIVEAHVKAYVMVELKGTHLAVDKDIHLYMGSELHILYRNECSSLQTKESICVDQDAHIEVGYFALHPANTKIHAVYDLLQEGATVTLITTTYATTENSFVFECVHHCPHTYSTMDHYAICDKNGKYDITASGTIKKGAKASISHQSTRVLTLASKESVKVTPLLVIDENDVEASHACSIGEMNDEHLYYLQTRGLRREEALGLLTLSFLLPVIKVIEPIEDWKSELQKEIECKVGLK